MNPLDFFYISDTSTYDLKFSCIQGYFLKDGTCTDCELDNCETCIEVSGTKKCIQCINNEENYRILDLENLDNPCTKNITISN